MADMKTITGRVAVILESGDDITEFEADCGGGRVKAVCYPGLTGSVKEGDEVLLNATAVKLGLGSGGRHFVIANLSNPQRDLADVHGHIMKLRYTPMQCRVMSAEEEGSPHRDSINEFSNLGGTPVLVGGLHSMLAPVCAALRYLSGEKLRIVYIMSDTGCLPIAFSRTVRTLKEKGLLNGTVTCGQAFGGDLEAVNKFSAMAVAKAALEADVIVAAPGIGVVGTGTELGNSALEVGEWVNAASALAGRPVVIPRIGFSDVRERHRGVSHHTITALARVSLARASVAVPHLGKNMKNVVMEQLADSGVSGKHEVIEADGSVSVDAMKKYDLRVTTMGRGVEEEPSFFLACGAAARIAHDMINSGK